MDKEFLEAIEWIVGMGLRPWSSEVLNTPNPNWYRWHEPGEGRNQYCRPPEEIVHHMDMRKVYTHPLDAYKDLIDAYYVATECGWEPGVGPHGS